MNNINETLQNLRGNYQEAKLDITDCNPNPVLQFDHWLENALKAECDEPNAFVLSTVNRDGNPRARVILLKGITEEKFVFYTNYLSAKGEELEENSRVAMTFLWLPLQRQVRIEGIVNKGDGQAAESYFQKRPRGSQLGAIASPQSKVLGSRSELEELFKNIEDRYEQIQNLPRPPHWGGYEITPDYYEFWQGRPNRMHDRICYEKKDSGWSLFRLAP